MQNDATTIEKALDAILGPSWSNDHDAATIAAFTSDLLDLQFFPLPKQVRSLAVRAALMRYEHLRQPVRARLTEAVKTLWAKHLENSQQTAPIAPHEPPAPVSTNDSKTPRADHEPDIEHQPPPPEPPQPGRTQERVKESPFSNPTPPKRDLFDMVLDFVAALIGLFR